MDNDLLSHFDTPHSVPTNNILSCIEINIYEINLCDKILLVMIKYDISK